LDVPVKAESSLTAPDVVCMQAVGKMTRAASTRHVVKNLVAFFIRVLLHHERTIAYSNLFLAGAVKKMPALLQMDRAITEGCLLPVRLILLIRSPSAVPQLVKRRTILLRNNATHKDYCNPDYCWIRYEFHHNYFSCMIMRTHANKQ
jgi:hypothetical protein